MNTVLAVLAAVSLWLNAGDARASGAEAAYYGPCYAQRVVTGDSADVRCGDEVVRVRLLDVAAPGPSEIGHDEARRALQQLLSGRNLWLGFAAPGRPTLDRDGQFLAHLYDGDGRNLNVELVRLGWAAYSTKLASGRFAANFRAAEGEARVEQRALWSVWSVTAEQGR